jgi:hypothetical protein
LRFTWREWIRERVRSDSDGEVQRGQVQVKWKPDCR